MDISLADFGTHCEEHNYYEEAVQLKAALKGKF
jgi:hypothetical protein